MRNFPSRPLKKAGYGAIWARAGKSWNGVAHPGGRDVQPVVTPPPQLPGDASDNAKAVYIEAAVQGIIVGCLYAPNGKPAARSRKFTYKLAWLQRLARPRPGHSPDFRVARSFWRETITVGSDRSRHLSDDVLVQGCLGFNPKKPAAAFHKLIRQGLDRRDPHASFPAQPM